jgi:hypothetical protein
LTGATAIRIGRPGRGRPPWLAGHGRDHALGWLHWPAHARREPADRAETGDGALPTLYTATADIPGGAFAGPSGFGGMRGAPKLVKTSQAAGSQRSGDELLNRGTDSLVCRGGPLVKTE